jgi:putative ABC transport system permease protein
MIVAAGLLALAPPVFGLPLAAYLSVALLLLGGIALLPVAVALVYDRLAPHLARRLLPMLAVERARRVRESAAVAISGVVASLSLAVALTVMVASFRDSMTHWLDQVLPADLYLRLAGSLQTGETNAFEPSFVAALSGVAGVQRVGAGRVVPVQLSPTLPAVALIARGFSDPTASLPLLAAPLAAPPGSVAVYVSEAMVDLYGARPGSEFGPALARLLPAGAPETHFFIAGVWRDYARQHGSVAIDLADYARLWRDPRISEVALWLAPGAQAAQVQTAILALAHDPALLQFASTGEIRRISLRIFDRSFAVTYWLQAVAIAIGLFGVAASFSAQVLARRKEFGLLAHLGLTRRQILLVVAGEGAAWTVIGSLAGLALGLAVSLVLVFVVNPQSFHWTMDMALPWQHLLALCLAVVAAGTASAWLAGRAAAGRDAVLAVKEDW